MSLSDRTTAPFVAVVTYSTPFVDGLRSEHIDFPTREAIAENFQVGQVIPSVNGMGFPSTVVSVEVNDFSQR